MDRFLLIFFSAIGVLLLGTGGFSIWLAMRGYVPIDNGTSESTFRAAQVANLDVMPPLFTEVQAIAGGEVYAETCAGCHGADPIEGGSAPPLGGPNFWERWQRQPVGALYGYIHDTMPPDAPASLSDTQYASVTAAILAANGFVAGDTALPASNETEAALDFGITP